MSDELDWVPAWRSAQALWGVSLHDPELVAEPAPPSFAWFSFPPQVTIDVPTLYAADAAADLESVFAHEIGHHVLSPSTRLDSLKLRHQLGRALLASDRPATPEVVALLSNLWSDQLINLRVAALQRRRDPAAEPGMIRLWRRLSAVQPPDQLSWVLRRAYELSWALPPGTLCAEAPPIRPAGPGKHGGKSEAGTEVRQEAPAEGPAARRSGRAARRRAKAAAAAPITAKLNERERELRQAQAEVEAAEQAIDADLLADPVADAHLLARLTSVFTDDPISGGLSFGMLAAPYLPRSGRVSGGIQLGCAGETGAQPPSPAEVGAILGDPRLSTPPVHPAAGPDLGAEPDPQATSQPSGGQGYGLAETLSLYDSSLADAVLAAWYRNQARPWVKPLTEQRPAADAPELPGPLEQWELGDDLADLDWPGSLTAAPEILPGVTTRRRARIDDPERPAEVSLRLDLYIDSSGSMPDPKRGSPAVLAGAILALSVLRGGGAVRATSWASPRQVAGPDRFLRDPVAVMAAIAYFFAGGTSFPLDLLQARYAGQPDANQTIRRHLVVLSDDGLDSMFGVGNDRYAQVAAQVRPRFTTATLVLLDRYRRVEPLARAAGYQVAYLDSMDDAPVVCARLAEVMHG
ncbi:MAG: hypothetical protein QM804_15975 [Propionicimonas sp.]